MSGRFLFPLDVNTVYGIHIQLTMLNTIENESKNRVQIKKMAIEDAFLFFLFVKANKSFLF